MDAKVGGSFRMSFTNFTTGNGHSFGGKYLELVPGESCVTPTSSTNPNLPGEMITTVSLKKVSCAPTSASCRKNSRRNPAEMCYPAGRNR